MTNIDLNKLLIQSGLNVTYGEMTEPPELPYIIYLFSDSDNFGADNTVYYNVNNFDVELYSNKKDLANERKLEDIFNNNDIFWEKRETYIDSESMHQVVYEIRI